MSITDTEALTRVIEHREIFHDEMLALMRRIMSGEMSPVMIAAWPSACASRRKRWARSPPPRR
jgi:anthranilate phosphoribosyltransferase